MAIWRKCRSLVARPNIPDFGHFRESSRRPARRNAGFRPVCGPLPSIVFGKVPKWHPMTASLPLGRVGRSITVSISTPGDCGPSDGMRGEAVIVPTVRAAIALLMIPMILIYAVLAGVAFPGAWVVTALWPAGGRPMRVRLAT